MSFTWRTSVTIPENVPDACRLFMEMIYSVAKLANVPSNAAWKSTQNGRRFEVQAKYDKKIIKLNVGETPKIRFNL